MSSWGQKWSWSGFTFSISRASLTAPYNAQAPIPQPNETRRLLNSINAYFTFDGQSAPVTAPSSAAWGSITLTGWKSQYLLNRLNPHTAAASRRSNKGLLDSDAVSFRPAIPQISTAECAKTTERS